VVLPLSARTPAALARHREELATHLEGLSAAAGSPCSRPVTLDSVAWTLQDGRTPLEHRTAVVAADVSEAVRQLRNDTLPCTRVTGADDGVVLMLPGQGSQAPGMAKELYAQVPSFAASVDSCAELIRDLAGVDVLPMLLDPDVDASLVNETRVTQPLLFTMEVAVAAALAAWGVRPRALIGHSVGEVVAAHLSGALDLDDALRLICARGRLMQECPPGAMLAVAAHWPDVSPLVGDRLDLAAVNGPRAITLAGDAADVDEAAALLQRLDVPAVKLPTVRAFHSRLVDGALEELREIAASLSWRAPVVPFVSGVTGEWMTAERCADPDYWARQAREAVRFDLGLETVLSLGDPVLVEAGPGRALRGFAAAARAGVRVALAAPKGSGGAADLLGALWTSGVAIDWRATWPTLPGRTHLPTYSFDRTRHWVDPDPDHAPVVSTKPSVAGPRDLDDGALGLPVWRQTAPSGAARGLEGPWLAVVGNDGTGRALVDALASVTPVVALSDGPLDLSPAAADGSTAWWTADLASRDDLTSVLETFAAQTGARRVPVLAAVALDEPACPGDDAVTRIASSATRLFDRLLALSQAVAAAPDLETEVVVVTDSMADVVPGAPVRPEQAVALGPVLLLPREVSHAKARAVDVCLAERAETDVVRDLVRELAQPEAEAQVALRAGRRLVREYVPFGLPEVAMPFQVRSDGAYVVTGGLGGIGLEVAHHLVRQGARDVVLVSRRDFPAMQEWESDARAPGTSEAHRRLLQRLLAMGSAGARVSVEQCDVADIDQVRSLAARLAGRGARTVGVMHCAGVAGGGMLAARTVDAAHRVLAPKLQGTVNLFSELGSDLDALVLFSSITAVTGTFGMVDYCAANNFLDAFASWATARGVPAVSIGWDGWSEVGMAEELTTAAPAAYRALQDGGAVRGCSHPLVDRVLSRSADELVAETDLWPGRHWISREHVVRGQEVVVGTAFVEMVRACWDECVGVEVHLESIAHLAAVAVNGSITVRVHLRRDDAGTWQAEVMSYATGSSPAGGTAVLAATLVPGCGVEDRVVDLDRLRGEHPLEVSAEDMESSGLLLTYGERWQSIVSTVYTDRSEVVELVLPTSVCDDIGQFVLHPALLDSCVADGQHNPMVRARGDSYLPLSYERLAWTKALPARAWSHIRHLDDRDGDVITVDVDVYDADGHVVAEIRGFALRRVDAEGFSAALGRETTDSSARGVQEQSTSLGWKSIDPELGIEALHRILGWWPAPHVIVTPEGIEEALRDTAQLDVAMLEEQLGDVRLSDQRVAGGGEAGTERPATPREQQLADLWSSVLGVEHVSRHDSFFDLGGNSLVAVQLVARIRAVMGRRVGIAVLFDHPTLSGLAAALDDDPSPSAVPETTAGAR
jgi:acyl transferase domain-containing protein